MERMGFLSTGLFSGFPVKVSDSASENRVQVKSCFYVGNLFFSWQSTCFLSVFHNFSHQPEEAGDACRE